MNLRPREVNIGQNYLKKDFFSKITKTHPICMKFTMPKRVILEKSIKNEIYYKKIKFHGWLRFRFLYFHKIAFSGISVKITNLS
jgi:hypothetical protein